MTEAHNIVLDEKTKQAILSNPVLKEAMEVGYHQQIQAKFSSIPEACTGHLFWDHVHPTAAIHQLIAQYAKSTLDEAGFQAITQ
jgi:phospholipase/lecithinase/hemolysin